MAKKPNKCPKDYKKPPPPPEPPGIRHHIEEIGTLCGRGTSEDRCRKEENHPGICKADLDFGDKLRRLGRCFFR